MGPNHFSKPSLKRAGLAGPMNTPTHIRVYLCIAAEEEPQQFISYQASRKTKSTGELESEIIFPCRKSLLKSGRGKSLLHPNVMATRFLRKPLLHKQTLIVRTVRGLLLCCISCSRPAPPGFPYISRI